MNHYGTFRMNENPYHSFQGNTLLMTAILYGKREIAKGLLNKGLDVNTKNNDGFTALMYSSMYCNIEMVRDLLVSGADVTVKNNRGFSAYELALLRNNKRIAKELRAY